MKLRMRAPQQPLLQLLDARLGEHFPRARYLLELLFVREIARMGRHFATFGNVILELGDFAYSPGLTERNRDEGNSFQGTKHSGWIRKNSRYDYAHSKGRRQFRKSAARYDELESTRARLAQVTVGLAASIHIGTEDVTMSFAQHRLAWHDWQRAEREANFRQGAGRRWRRLRRRQGCLLAGCSWRWASSEPRPAAASRRRGPSRTKALH